MEVKEYSVIRHRMQFERNIVGFPFPNKASSEDALNIVKKVSTSAQELKLFNRFGFFGIDADSACLLFLLKEQYLLDERDLGCSKNRSGFIYGSPELSLLVNARGHLLIQSLGGGKKFGATLKKLQRADNLLKSKLDFSYSQKWGFITENPENAGSALRICVVLALPGLVDTENIEELSYVLRKAGVEFEPFWEDDDEEEQPGVIFCLRNKISFRMSEEDIFRNVIRAFDTVFKMEKKAVENIKRSRWDDRVWRALGLLQNARFISLDEALTLTSVLKVGISLDLLPLLSLNDILSLENELFSMFDVHHQIWNDEVDLVKNDKIRASLIRRRLLRKISERFSSE